MNDEKKYIDLDNGEKTTRRVRSTASITAALLMAGSVSSSVYAGSHDLMLPCTFSEKQGIPLAHMVNLDVAASTAKLLPKESRADFWFSLPVERHISNWWLQKIVGQLENKPAEDPLRPLLGVSLADVATVSSTSFSGPHTNTTYRFRLTAEKSTKPIAARLAERGLKQKKLDGGTIWWKGKDDELDFSFNRDDPFHFDLGKPQRFALRTNEIHLASHFNELKAAQACLSGHTKPTGNAAALRALSESFAAFLKTEKANLLAGFAWDQNVYFQKQSRLGALLSEQLSKTGSVDMDDLRNELRREPQSQETKPKLPLPWPVAPIFADAVTDIAGGSDKNKIERWALMAILFADAQSAAQAGPILIQRMKTLYRTKFKMTPPHFDVVVQADSNRKRYGLIIRARRPLLKNAGQSEINPISLWYNALVRGEFAVLSVE